MNKIYIILVFIALCLTGCQSDIEKLENLSIRYGCLQGTSYTLKKYRTKTTISERKEMIDNCNNIKNPS